MPTQEQLDNWFSYHPPTEEQVGVYEGIRGLARDFAERLGYLLPNGPEKDAVMMDLRKVVMLANLSVACAVPEQASMEEFALRAVSPGEFPGIQVRRKAFVVIDEGEIPDPTHPVVGERITEADQKPGSALLSEEEASVDLDDDEVGGVDPKRGDVFLLQPGEPDVE